MKNHHQTKWQRFEVVKPTPKPEKVPLRKTEKRDSSVKRARFLQLIRSVFTDANKPCRTVAVVALESRNGTSTIISRLGAEMAMLLGESVIVANSEDLPDVELGHGDRILHLCTESRIPNLWRLNPMAVSSLRPASQFPQSPQQPVTSLPVTSLNEQGQSMRALSAVFDYVLLDCPALSHSSDALILAPEVDGIVMVVEAERTTYSQVQNATKQINQSGGEVLGFVLNKHKIPRNF